MRSSIAFRIAIAVSCSCVTVACQTAPATDGAGYQFVRFADPAAARAASQDVSAGPAIASNNRQCARDAACRK